MVSYKKGMDRSAAHPGFRHFREAALTSIAYFPCAAATLILTRFDGGVAIVWLASSVLFAALCARPRRRWTGIVLLCLPTAMLASHLFGMRGWASIPLPLICVAEAVFAAWLIKRAYPRFGRFQSVPEVGWFLAIGGFAVPATTALLAAWCVHQARGISFGIAWRDWYAGHALGLVAFAPPMLLTLRGQTRQWIATAGSSRMREALVLIGLVAAASLAAFGQERIPLVILPFMPMIAATLRLGRFGAIVSIVVLLAIALPLSIAGHGPTMLLRGDIAVRLQVLQVYFASIVLILLPLAAELRTRRRLFERMNAAEALHRVVLDRTSDIIIRLGVDGTLRYASPSTERVWGYRPDELTGRIMFHLVSAEDLPAVLEARRRVLASPDETAIAEYRVLCKDGDWIWMESHMRAVLDEKGAVIGNVSIVREVTGRRKLMEDITHQAMTDPLTGLYNRRAFEEALPALLASGDGSEALGCVAVFDLDHFKRINDRFGHACGDLVLQRFADVLRASVREGDLVSRLGGEEFAVVLGGMGPEQARLVCERIRKRTERAEVHDRADGIIHVTVSAGIAPLARGQGDDEALRNADLALYRAKNAGRNRSELAA